MQTGPKKRLEKVMFSDETHFYVQGQSVAYVRKASNEKKVTSAYPTIH